MLETIWGDLKRGVESAVNDGVKDRFDEHVNKYGMTAKTFDYPDGVRAQLFADGVAFIFLPGDNKPDLMIKNMNNGHYDYSTNGKDWQLKYNAIKIAMKLVFRTLLATAFAIGVAKGVAVYARSSSELISVTNARSRGMLSSRFFEEDLCKFHDVRIDPSGRQVVLFNRQPATTDTSRDSGGYAGVAMMRVDDQQPQAAGRTLVSFRGLQPVGWLSSGALLLQQGSSSLIAVKEDQVRSWSIDDLAFFPLDQRGLSWIRGVGPLGTVPQVLAQHQEGEAALRSIGSPWGTMAVSASRLRILGIRQQNGTIRVLDNAAGVWRTTERIPALTYEPQASMAANGTLAWSFGGEVASTKAHGRDVIAQPLIDEATGKAVGWFTPWRIQQKAKPKPQVQVTKGDRVLSASSAGNRTAVLLQNGESRTVFIQDEGVRLKVLASVDCGSPASRSRTDPDSSFFTDRLRDVGSESGRNRFANRNYDLVTLDHGTGLTAQYIDNGSDTVTVLFGGGPGGSVLDGTDAVRLDKAVAGRSDVLVVSYSGAADAGRATGARLAKSGIAALREDAAAVSDWVRSHRKRKVLIYGISFGAVPAVQLASMRDVPGRRLFLQVPLLRLRDPDEWLSCRNNITNEQQMAFERDVFGGRAARRRFVDALAGLMADYRADPRDFVEFGAADCVSKAVDLPGSYTGKIVTSAGDHHIFDSKTLSHIVNQLDEK